MLCSNAFRYYTCCAACSCCKFLLSAGWYFCVLVFVLSVKSGEERQAVCMMHCRKPTLAGCTICRQTSRQQAALTLPHYLTQSSFLRVQCLPLLLPAPHTRPGRISMPLVLTVQTLSWITCTEALHGPRLHCKPSPHDAAASLVSWQTQ